MATFARHLVERPLGAWLYEIGNMDHSAMQGVEFVNQVLFGEPERVWIPRGEVDGVAEIR